MKLTEAKRGGYMKTKKFVYFVDKIIRRPGNIIVTKKFDSLSAAKEYAEEVAGSIYGYRISEVATIETVIEEEI